VRVLVTGHHGYIGSVLCPLLLQHGHQVVGFDTEYFSDYDFLPPEARVEERRGDVRNIQQSDLEGFDAVVHLAALSNDPMGKLDARLTDDINHKASVRLGRLAREAGVSRFVFSSSCSTYGAGSDDILDETAEFRPVSAYAVSKVDTESGLSALASDSFSPIFLRNATAYGLSPRMRADLVVANFVGWAVTTGEIRIMSDGTPWRPIVHIRDISAAMAAVLEAPRQSIHNVAFNVGRDQENYRVREIADVVASVVPGTRIVYAGTGEPDKRSYRVSFAKITRELPGFQPQWDVEKGAREIYEAFRRRELTLEQFEGRHLIRLEQLRYLMQNGQVDSDLCWTSAASARVPA